MSKEAFLGELQKHLEILEAYHVKPEFGEEKRRKRLPVPGGEALEKGGMGLQSLGGFLREKTAALFRGAGNLFRKAGRSVKNLGLRIKESMSVRKKGRPDAETGGEGRMEMTGNLRIAEGRSLGKAFPEPAGQRPAGWELGRAGACGCAGISSGYCLAPGQAVWGCSLCLASERF